MITARHGQGIPRLDTGTPVDVVPKNPFFSTTLWGIVCAMIFHWLSRQSWWSFDQATTVQVLLEIGQYVALGVAAWGRARAMRPLGFSAESTVKIVHCFAPILLCLMLISCGVSQSYQAGIKASYGKVADRIDQLSGHATMQGAALRASTQPTITFTAAQQAWNDAAPVYRQLVQTSSLNAQRRADWLETAEALDRLNNDEAKHESILGGK